MTLSRKLLAAALVVYLLYFVVDVIPAAVREDMAYWTGKETTEDF